MNKRKIVLICSLVLVGTVALCIFLKKDAVFQRGNPIPYLVAAVQLSQDNPYVAVDEENGIYISKRVDKEALFNMIQDTYGVVLKDQLGSSYLFSDGENNYTISSEIYWGRFTVWTLPKE